MTRLIDASEIRAMMAAHARGGRLDAQTFSELLADDIEARAEERRESAMRHVLMKDAERRGEVVDIDALMSARPKRTARIERASDDWVEYVLP